MEAYLRSESTLTYSDETKEMRGIQNTTEHKSSEYVNAANSVRMPKGHFNAFNTSVSSRRPFLVPSHRRLSRKRPAAFADEEVSTFSEFAPCSPMNHADDYSSPVREKRDRKEDINIQDSSLRTPESQSLKDRYKFVNESSPFFPYNTCSNRMNGIEGTLDSPRRFDMNMQYTPPPTPRRVPVTILSQGGEMKENMISNIASLKLQGTPETVPSRCNDPPLLLDEKSKHHKKHQASFFSSQSNMGVDFIPEYSENSKTSSFPYYQEVDDKPPGRSETLFSTERNKTPMNFVSQKKSIRSRISLTPRRPPKSTTPEMTTNSFTRLRNVVSAEKLEPRHSKINKETDVRNLDSTFKSSGNFS